MTISSLKFRMPLRQHAEKHFPIEPEGKIAPVIREIGSGIVKSTTSLLCAKRRCFLAKKDEKKKRGGCGEFLLFSCKKLVL